MKAVVRMEEVGVKNRGSDGAGAAGLALLGSPILEPHLKKKWVNNDELCVQPKYFREYLIFGKIF